MDENCEICIYFNGINEICKIDYQVARGNLSAVCRQYTQKENIMELKIEKESYSE